MHAPPRRHATTAFYSCLLSFRVYAGCQCQNNLMRDTLQRFLLDVHGEESYNNNKNNDSVPAALHCSISEGY